jgi:hypothetical protein
MPKPRTFGFDQDTLAYSKRVFEGAGRQILLRDLRDIDLFVRGVKKLNLWDKMVCWPMRWPHNAARGLTVYSLGGLGVYNGTLVNSPIWTDNGLLISPSSIRYYGTTTLKNIPTNKTIFCISNRPTNATAGSPCGFGSSGTNGSAYFIKTGNTSISTDIWYDGVSYSINTQNRFASLFSSHNENTVTQSADKNAPTHTSKTVISGTSATFVIGAVLAGEYQTGIISIAGFLSIYIADCRPIHDLYKNTIGKGLSLA